MAKQDDRSGNIEELNVVSDLPTDATCGLHMRIKPERVLGLHGEALREGKEETSKKPSVESVGVASASGQDLRDGSLGSATARDGAHTVTSDSSTEPRPGPSGEKKASDTGGTSPSNDSEKVGCIYGPYLASNRATHQLASASSGFSLTLTFILVLT